MKAITDTFVLVAEDRPAALGTLPANRGGAPSVESGAHRAPAIPREGGPAIVRAMRNRRR